MNLELNPIAQRVADWLERRGKLEQTRDFYLKQTAAIAILGRQIFVRLAPHNVQNYERLAKAFLQQRRYAEAAAACKTAIQLHPDLPYAYHTLGEALQAQGLWAEAIDAFKQAIELDGTIAWFHQGLGKAYMSRDNWPAAIAALRTAHELDPTEFWTCYSLGEALTKGGYWAEAIAVLEKATAQQSIFPWAYYYLGDAYLAEERLEEAIVAYQAAVALRPHNPHIKQNLDYALYLREQEQKIDRYCQQVKARSAAPRDEQLDILMITPYAPYPPQMGAVARMFHELKALSARHRVVLVSLMFAKEEHRFEADLEQYCDLAILLPLGDNPVREPHEAKIVNRYSSKRLRKVLQKLQVIPFDLVSYNFVYMAQYQDLFPNAFNVLAEHNIESELLKRSTEIANGQLLINQLAGTDSVRAFVEAETEAQLLAAYEDEVWKQFPLRTVVSDRDQQLLDHRCTAGKTIVVNNGIDTQAIAMLPPSPHKRMLFIGTMGYFPNIDAVNYCVEAILPNIWKLDPTIEFWIAGAMPPKQILDLAADPRIQVIADPEDMGAVAAQCCLSIVPIRFGSGTRIKILHAMALGLPVVSTSLGCEGLEVRDGTHLLIQDEPAQFAQSVVQLLADQKLQQTLRHQGRQLVEAKYDWNTIYAAAERQYVASYQAWKAQTVSLAR